MKYIYVVLGCIALGLGAVGTVVPFLPSVPFLLLAAMLFGKSSKRLHDWFIQTTLYKKNLESFVQGRGMTTAAKLRLMLTVTVIMAIAFLLMAGAPAGRIAIIIVWVIHVICFLFFVPVLSEHDEHIQNEGDQEK